MIKSEQLRNKTSNVMYFLNQIYNISQVWPQETPGYLHLLMHTQFLLHKAGQNSKFWAAPTNLGGMPFHEHPSKLFSTQNTPLHEPTCQPLTIHYTLTFYTISCFSIVYVCEKGGKGGREITRKWLQNIEVFCLLRKATINIKKGKTTTSVFHKFSRTLTSS